MKNFRYNFHKTINNKNTFSLSQEQYWILNENSSFLCKESYNSLRTNIIFSIPKEGCKIIGITSAERAEGKSINVLNLAISLSEINKRVLLIDCDLRKPKIARLLDLKSSPGITNVLVGLTGLNKTIQSTKYKNLDVLLSGDIPPNPTELIGSLKLTETLHILSEQYDYIFIDTPPVNVVTDACILSNIIEGYIFLIRLNISERNTVVNAIEKLKFVNAKILGIIINNKHQYKSLNKKQYNKYDIK